MSVDRLSAAVHAAMVVALADHYEYEDGPAPHTRFIGHATKLVTSAVRRELAVPEPNPTAADGTPIVLWSAEFGHLYTDVDSFPLAWQEHVTDAVPLTVEKHEVET